MEPRLSLNRKTQRGPAQSSAPRASAAASGLSRLDIAVALPRDRDSDLLMRELQRTRARVRHVWPVAEKLPSDTDVIYCDLTPGLVERMPWLTGRPKAALVVVLDARPDLELLHNVAADAVLHRPIAADAVAVSLMQAHSTFAYGDRLRSRIDKLDETLRALRSVERAKAILMQRNQMREDDAYGYLRRQAMDRHATISSVAAAIIDAHEILE
jgi:AmiR/NasT family two-component response regulator